MLVLAFPSYDHTWFGWVGAVSLLLSTRRLRPWQAFLIGWLEGSVYFVEIFPWINEVLSISKLVIGLGHLHLCLYFDLFYAFMNLVLRRIPLPFWWLPLSG